MASILGIVYAISTELLQNIWFIGRHASLVDAANIVGVSIGILIFARINTKKLINYKIS